jgi:hypothetical protein
MDDRTLLFRLFVITWVIVFLVTLGCTVINC